MSFFVVVRAADGNKRRVTLGRYPRVSIKSARTRAKETTGQAAAGVDVVEAKQEKRRRRLTLSEALDQYIEHKTLKPTTVEDYRRAIKDTFGDLLDKELTKISREMVLKRYQKSKSAARADNAARVLRAIYNFSRVKHQRADGSSPYDQNPVSVVRDLGVRRVVQRRKGVIHSHQVAPWWQAVEGLKKRHSARLL